MAEKGEPKPRRVTVYGEPRIDYTVEGVAMMGDSPVECVLLLWPDGRVTWEAQP